MSTIVAVFKNALMISAFVLVMMLLVEYLNVLTRGWIRERLARSGWPQYLAAAILGATPGCLGAYAVVALFAHRAASLGALVAAMIATSGDEAFVLFALVPRTALPLTLALLVIGLGAGWLTDRVLGERFSGWLNCCDDLTIHEPHIEQFPLRAVPGYFRHLSLPRALLLGGTLLIILGILTGDLVHDHFVSGGQVPSHTETEHVLPPSDAGQVPSHTEAEHVLPPAAAGQVPSHTESAQTQADHGHAHAAGAWGWLRVTFLLVSLTALYIVTVVPEHFLEEHLWRHVVWRHLPTLFLWTLGALLVLAWLQGAVRPESWLSLNPVWLVLSAALVGIIPESGPHLIYVSSYAQGLIPLSVLVVSSIVQDGHGMLPLLAESRRAFLLVKGINLLFGLLIGGLLLLLERGS